MINKMNGCFLYMTFFKECIQGSMLAVDTLTKPQKPTPTSNKSRPDQSHSSGPCEATSGFLKLFLQLYY